MWGTCCQLDFHFSKISRGSSVENFLEKIPNTKCLFLKSAFSQLSRNVAPTAKIQVVLFSKYLYRKIRHSKTKTTPTETVTMKKILTSILAPLEKWRWHVQKNICIIFARRARQPFLFRSLTTLHSTTLWQLKINSRSLHNGPLTSKMSTSFLEWLAQQKVSADFLQDQGKWFWKKSYY